MESLADEVGVKREFIRRLIKSGKLPATRLGARSWRVAEEDWQAFLASNPVIAPAREEANHAT
jgi:excisionase family DNA binding protein